MRPAVITSLLALSLTPVHAGPVHIFGNHPIPSAANGFLPSNHRGGQGNQASAAAAAAPAASTANTVAPGPTTSVNLNGQKGVGGNPQATPTGAAAATAQSTGANAIFNPNAPTPQSPTAPAPFATGAAALTNKAQATSLQSACQAWVSDTSVVSNFLNIGNGLVLNTQQFVSQAGVALASEKDELLHKATIDQIIGLDPQISQANLTLTDGSFQSVVNGLQDMTTNGPSRVGDIVAINNVRCPQVLPAIDTYCHVAAQYAAQQGVQILSQTAVRPTVCQHGQVQKRSIVDLALNRR